MSLSGANITDKRIKEELKDPRHRMVLAELDAAALKSPAFIDPAAQGLMPVGVSNQAKLKVEDTMTLMFSKNKEQVQSAIENNETLNEGINVNADGKDSKLQSRLKSLKGATKELSKEEKAAKEKAEKDAADAENAKLLQQSGLVPIGTDGAEDPAAAANFHKTVDGNMYRGSSFNPLLWKQYLIRHHMYATLCWRCAHILGLNRTPTNSEASDD